MSKLTLAGGTDTEASGLTSSAGTGSGRRYIATDLLDQRGVSLMREEPPNPPPPSPPGESMISLETKMIGAFAWLTLLTVACGAAFLFLISQFGDVRKEVSATQATTASQSATITAIQSTLTRIETKLDKQDDNSQRSARAGQDGTIPSPARKPKDGQ